MFLKYIFHLTTCLKQVSLFVTNVTKSPTQWVILRRNHQKGSQRFSFCQNLDHKILSSACFLLSTEIDTRDLQKWNNAYLTYNKIIIFNLERIQNHTKLNFSFKNFKFFKKLQLYKYWPHIFRFTEHFHIFYHLTCTRALR